MSKRLEEIESQLSALSIQQNDLRHQQWLVRREEFAENVNLLIDKPIADWTDCYFRVKRIDYYSKSDEITYFQCKKVFLDDIHFLVKIITKGKSYCLNLSPRNTLVVDEDTKIDFNVESELREITKEEYDKVADLYNQFYNHCINGKQEDLE